MPPEYSSKESDEYLDLEQDGIEELGDQVQKAKAELEKLRQQQEQIEKEKQRLEELKRKQEELESGRSEMLDKLTRSVAMVQREAEETQKRLEQLQTIHGSFIEHVRAIESLNPKTWTSSEMPRELSKALSIVEAARVDYSKAQSKISTEAVEMQNAANLASYEQEYGSTSDQNFVMWFKNGMAFTLPLQILGILGLLVWVWSILSTSR